MKKNKQGFTIVELVIVVLMIGVLMTIGFVSMTKYVGDSQDTKILSDMKMIDDKLDLAFVSLKKYPMPDNIYSTGMLNGQVVSYAGYVGEKVTKIIDLNDPIINPTNGEMYRYAVNVSRTKTQLATLKKDKVNYLVGGNFDGKIKTSSGETVIPSIVYVNTGSVDLKNDTLVYLGGSSSTPSTPPPVVQDPEFTGNCLADLKPADVDALNNNLITNITDLGNTDGFYYFDTEGSEVYLKDIGPLSKEQWCSLTQLTAGASFEVSSIPRSIGKLNNLTDLSLAYIAINSIPDTIGYLTNLEYFSIDGNNITSLPVSIGNLTKLKTFSAGGNGLTDLPKEFTQLVNLENILLQDNDLTYEAFGENNLYKFDSLTKVNYIDLSNNSQLGDLARIHSSSSPYNYYIFNDSGLGDNNFTITIPGNGTPLQFDWNKTEF